MRLLNRLILGLFLTSVVLGLLSAGLAWWVVFRPMPRTAGQARVSGLRQEVTVRRDSMGIPHITARSLADLYFAQGYVTAQDRLWQMDMIRRMAGGSLAEVAGESMLRSDNDKRILGVAGIARSAARELPEQERRLFEAYAAGVNAYITTAPLPFEFRVLRYRPAPWKPEDSILVALQMFQSLTTTWRDELFKLLLLDRAGPERTAELLPVRTDRDHPPADEMRAPAGKRPAVRTTERPPEPRGLIGLRRASSRPGVSGRAREWFGFDTCAAADPDDRSRTIAPVFGSVPAAPPAPANLGWCEPPPADALPGSNNWVVSGARTASGRAMLANDPHLSHTVPSTWYSVHLQAPGMNVAGVSLPGLPAVIIGHNGDIAWGMTNLGADVQDVYIETFQEGTNRYLVDGEWREAELRPERVEERGGGVAQFSALITRHGPIMLSEAGKRYSLRWVAAEKGIWRFPFFQLNAAGNWEAFRAALAPFPGPAQNFVYADRDGNIGYQAAGKIPVRPRGDGSMPLDGSDTANDWRGYIPFDELPRVYNPPSGIIATANGRVAPDDYPYPVATKWESPDRTERIYQLLAMDRKFRPEDFTKIQTDVYSAHYKLLAGALAEALKRRGADARAAQLAARLEVWPGEVWADSSDASVVQFARHELLKQLLEPHLGAFHVWYRWRMSTVFLETVLRERPAHWLPPGVPDYDELLARSAARAAATLGEQFHDPDSSRWPWGALIRISFAHPMAGRLPGFARSWFVTGPFAQAGNTYTVKQTTPGLGASMRLVVDFADLDGTLLTLTMGESGHAFSRHFGDQFDAWYQGGGVAFPFSDESVTAASNDTLRLLP